MIARSQPEQFLNSNESIIDVRSPGEFAFGHIPGAFNIPLFTDDERAVIGTIYHRQGREPAVLKGLDIALPKVEGFLETLRSITRKGILRVHCWRGGMRSGTMAELFEKNGYRVILLEGGYKAYRSFIRLAFSRPARVMVLGGYTGCGKTDILKALSAMGEQVVDLEELACHKGSVFGALGQSSQPTNEQFENELYRIWSALDSGRRIWLEDESRSIGKVALPPPVFDLISNSPMVEVILEREERIDRLVREYAGFSKECLSDSLYRIREGLGGTRFRTAMDALQNNDFRLVASTTLEYYDKAYRKAMEKRQNKEVLTLTLGSMDPGEQAASLLEKVKDL